MRNLIVGEMEPNLTVDIVNRSLADNTYVFTQYYSSYLFYKNNIVDSHKVNIYYISGSGAQKVPLDVSDMTLVRKASVLEGRIGKKDSGAFDDYHIKVVKEIKSLLPNLDLTSVVFWNVSGMLNIFLQSLSSSSVTLNILENGFVRPKYITLDNYGVNVESGYFRGKFLEKKEGARFNENVDILENKKSYLKYRILDFINPSVMSKNRLSLLSIVRRRLKKLLPQVKETRIDYPSNYVFVPLQLLGDTQSVFYSHYSNHLDFIFDVRNYVDEKYSSELAIVFKIHPLDTITTSLRINSDDLESINIFMSNDDTDELISNSKLVCCVNSTVGFESIIKGKETILFGRALYENVNGVVSNVSEPRKNRKLKGNASIEDFILSTQVEFNISSYTSKQLDGLVRYLR